MYLYTAHRAKNTFHMAKATLTIKNNPQSKRTFPTFSGQGYSYTHAQLREQSDYILHWPSMAIFTLKHNSGSIAYISYRPTKAVHSNKLTEQTDYFLYWPWTATLTLKHVHFITVINGFTDWLLKPYFYNLTIHKPPAPPVQRQRGQGATFGSPGVPVLQWGAWSSCGGAV